MTAQEARALVLAYELYGLLDALSDRPEHRRGSRVAVALDCADELVGLLSPEPSESSVPKLVVINGTILGAKKLP